jgi:hypothetical protein
MVYDANDSVDSSSLLEEEKALLDARSVPSLMDPNSGTHCSILHLLRNRSNIRVLDEVKHLRNS